MNVSAAEVHRFVPVGRAMEWVRLGWLPLPTLADTHHADYRVHVVWLCCCGVKDDPPSPVGQRTAAHANVRLAKEQAFRHRHIATVRRRH
jgi:hypothetical protein